MSDMSYLFRESKITPSPSKALFPEERSRDRPRSKHSIRKTVVNVNTIPSSTLAKCYLSKSNLKKELIYYNNQTLLVFLRKTLFLMAAVLIFNIFATGTNQNLICANLALTSISIWVISGKYSGWDPLGVRLVKYFQLLARISIYCLNFYLFFSFIAKKSSSAASTEARVIISINAALNYIIFLFCQKIVTLRNIRNQQTPYMSHIQKLITCFQNYLTEFRSIFYLGRPLIAINLAYWLIAIAYIIKNQDQLLFEALFSRDVARAFVATSLLLYTYLYLLKLIDIFLSIELITPNKKQINLNLLRLDGKNQNNFDIQLQIEKYIWKNSQFFWDTEFLSHRYSINYDILEDHIVKSFGKLQALIKEATYQIENQVGKGQVKDEENRSNQGWKGWRVIKDLFMLISALESKKYLFFIVHQITSFQKMGTTAPIEMDSIFKALRRTSVALRDLHKVAPIRQFRFCLASLDTYIEDILKCTH